LAVGAEPGLKPLELEPEFVELEPEPEFVELEPEPVEPDPVELDPDEPELAEDGFDEAELDGAEFDEAEFDDAEPELLDALVLCVEPGRTRASAPAVTTLAMVTAVVVDRTLARPRSLAAWAWRIPSSRRVLLMPLILRSGNRKSLHEPYGSAMSQARLSRFVRAEAIPATLRTPEGRADLRSERMDAEFMSLMARCRTARSARSARSAPWAPARARERNFRHFSTTRTRSYDVDVPFMQLERHGWDIHAVSAGRARAGAGTGRATEGRPAGGRGPGGPEPWLGRARVGA
jgi:hypothetical protein